MNDRLKLVFPWMESLPESARAQFVGDFLENWRGSLDVARMRRLSATVATWRGTARSYAGSQ
ncbi:hypothetical protein D5S18_10515 [Nocardia panacis]|uniref:Uncharacterized protein n=1 Tax=Nocardia panacis TaxID=2340916 RepID=A0A3A4KJ79_9NOCA|nr:hypothetical protein [Nocardia panacis]RJO76694.1 hypothetical protein D5S18_10515 [Nocardia panacis]